MDLHGSKTQKNLYRTFAGESRSSTKYKLYAEKARKDGLCYISQVFEETAANELAHARRVYDDFLKNVLCTKTNLLEAAKGESLEYNDMYKRFAKEAEEEGFIEIANFFKELEEVEEEHHKKFVELYKKLENSKMFTGDKDSKWVCSNCGYTHTGEEAPKACPLCKYPQGYAKPYCKTNS